MLKVTVIVPTTGNRGSLLPYSIGSIQNQSVQDIEIFIIGDGVTNETKKVIEKLKNEDSRIKFFGHPKNERRGEIYRHRALQEAKGRIVCYLCDRDLMLPNHIETMTELLEKYNFASTTYVDVKKDQSITIGQNIKYYGPASENKKSLVKSGDISLSNAGHTLDLYKKLPFGWRTTPKNEYTDVYMWKQFLAHPECTAYSHHDATILYFKRGSFPGPPVSEREKELSIWAKRILNSENVEPLKTEAFKGLLIEKNQLKLFRNKMHKSTILIKGYEIKEVPRKFFQRSASRLKRLLALLQ